jgi:hypothetical protein
LDAQAAEAGLLQQDEYGFFFLFFFFFFFFFFSFFSSFHPRLDDSVSQRRSLGGFFAVLVFAVMFVLFVSEFSEWIQPRTKSTLSVDVVRGEKLTISFDITFHRLVCDDVTIDLLDESGAHFTAIGHDVKKYALDTQGQTLHTYVQGKLSDAGSTSLLQHPGYCHDCLKEISEEHHKDYLALRKKNAVPQCCNTCPALMMTYQLLKIQSAVALLKQPCRPQARPGSVAGEVGCRTVGFIEIPKIGGNMHVAAGKSGVQDHGTHTHHMHRVNFQALKQFNISHTISKLHFGEGFYGKVDPLTGVEHWEKELAQYTYYVNVVPTVVIQASGRESPSHQYSYTLHREKVDLGSRSFKLPGLFIKYSFDALRMTKRAHPHSTFTHFLTRICALLGGSYVFFGLIYSVTSSSIDYFKKND